MDRNVVSWNVAISKGFEPRLYPYTFEEVPLGEYGAVLDLKIWAKKVMAINCYFTQADTGKKFQLTVYCKHNSGVYKLEGCDIDFANCPIAKTYRIKVFADQKKKIVFSNAMLM